MKAETSGAEDHFANTPVDADHPWLGLKAYTEETQAYFYGRDEEIREIYTRVRENSLTILFGPSGLGKTSLLGAGLIPKLKVEGYWPVLLRLDMAQAALPPIEQTRSALYKFLGIMPSNACLWEILHHKPSRPEDLSEHPLVLIFDQFEEMFTRTDTRSAGVHAWLSQMSDLIENRPPLTLQERFRADRRLAREFDTSPASVRVVITLREDYLSYLERWKDKLPSLMRNRMALNLLTGPQALEAAVRPGSRSGRPIVSEEVGAQIVRKIARRSESTALAEIEAMPPFLSLFCEQLNLARLGAAPPEQTITADLVSVRGDDILDTYYEESFQHHRPAVRAFIEDHLVSTSGYRNNVPREDAEIELKGLGVSDPAGVLDDLIARRLLTAEERGDVIRLELTHDVLIPLVVRSRSIRKEQEALAAARRQKRRQVMFAGILVGLVLIFAGLAAFGWMKSIEAEKNAARANTAREQAEELVGFMTFNLRDKLATVGRLDLMEDVVRSVERYHQRRADLMNQGGAKLLDPELRRRSVNYDNLGNIMKSAGNLPEAEKYYRTALEIRESLAARDPQNSQWQRDLFVSHEKLGDIMKSTGSLPEAEKHYRKALKISKSLAANDPANSQWLRDLAVNHERLGNFMAAKGDLPEAEKHYRTALEITQTLVARNPQNSQWQRDLCISYEQLGLLAMKRVQCTEARKCFEKEMLIADRLFQGSISHVNPQWNSDIGGMLCWSATFCGKHKQALAAGEKAVALLENNNPSPPRMNLAHAYLFNGHFLKARNVYTRYFGQKFEDGRAWNHELRKDFKVLRDAGQDHPDMKKIETLLDEAEKRR